MRIKKGDTVYVLCGEDKGKTGRVLHVYPKKGTAVVEGVRMHKRHQRPTQRNPKGGVVTMEGPIHLSNLAVYNASSGGPARLGVRTTEEDGRKRRVRIDVKTGEEI
ncbi:MAG TPA: 50S ribosomal protein L24 [candidate division Zixibacteria bacterium]|nr:50S ribosomal protein L24 [candidate division Zixibacteria bacterium]MDD4918436.1 50S ribosomal protein L24 [candidate division Zixibacteria bacterium]MDM7971763.1 50S ribosomal protein L24 [candidate division Zixibacteria bacterium]HOD67533.1 50S ribosomal protein L24 [candidate division Zixibacteria bacterium]HOZ07681.1 50S ribosomal protein L24 [candidate division Zixibacteria bacterium]